MAALTAGTKAPDFELKAMDGKRFSLQEELTHRPVVLAFFKGSCPVCQYAFPFLDRLSKAYGRQNVTLVGVSQDNPQATSAFMKEFGVTFPVLLDIPGQYPVSNAYGLTNVPTGWRDRSFQRRLGKGRRRTDRPQDGEGGQRDPGYAVPTQRGGA
jgi:peroxiredoxin